MKNSILSTFLLTLTLLGRVSAQCETQDTALGNCLSAFLTGPQELVCENCVDGAAFLQASNDCDAAASCSSLDSCTSVCGGTTQARTCEGEAIAKFTCELNDRRTTELNLAACPDFTCTGLFETETPTSAPVVGGTPVTDAPTSAPVVGGTPMTDAPVTPPVANSSAPDKRLGSMVAFLMWFVFW